MIWTRAKVRQRGMPTRCRECEILLPVGEVAYCPITFRLSRGQRLCAACVSIGRVRLADGLFRDSEPTLGKRHRLKRRKEAKP